LRSCTQALLPSQYKGLLSVTLFNSSDYDELERTASLLRVIPLLSRSRVLVSPPFKGTSESYTPEKVKQRLGVEMVAIDDRRY